ncbi:MAG: M48 family metallopeptidase [Clostridia bacterium]|nr:M48 family metallopeptidase [Clostridia bacterium]
MIEANVIRSKRRSIAIQITSEGEIVVRAPLKCSEKIIEKAINERMDWIEKYKQKILKNKEQNSEILSYNKVLFLGVKQNIIFQEKAKFEHIENNFIIPKKYENLEPKIKRLITKFMITKAESLFKDRVEHFSYQMNLTSKSLKICNSKRIWGSCSKTADLKLNWRLVMLSPELIDYVVVHELSHIVEFNHSKNFWKLVSSILKDCKQRRALLKKNDYLLNLYR